MQPWPLIIDAQSRVKFSPIPLRKEGAKMKKVLFLIILFSGQNVFSEIIDSKTCHITWKVWGPVYDDARYRTRLQIFEKLKRNGFSVTTGSIDGHVRENEAMPWLYEGQYYKGGDLLGMTFGQIIKKGNREYGKCIFGVRLLITRKGSLWEDKVLEVESEQYNRDDNDDCDEAEESTLSKLPLCRKI